MDEHEEREWCDWMHFVRRSGDEGKAWVADYRRHLTVWELCDEALALLRRRRFAEGEALLERARVARDALAGGVDPSIRAVLDRWYYGVLGYALYCRDRGDEADAMMGRAHEAVATAVGHRRFLLPLAYHCHEFYLHRARIARNRNRWAEMRDHVREVRGMMDGSVPFCTLAGGDPVVIDTIAGFYLSLAPLSEAEEKVCRVVIDQEVRMRGFDRFVHGMYRIPGAVIPYP
ncbi:MAG TPA: hypothetical protein VHG91_06180 [Longimicrobium sp.]|nr:hypothetical protein [Longimicrobium sp.]